jgi:very-short-patch-repair endonuclease
LVTHKGRVGAIEVDSEYHRGRRDFDKSREKLLEDAGVSYVDRIPAEDSGDDASLDEAVARFLKRLAS